MTTLKKSEILHRILEYIGERGAVSPGELAEFAKPLLGSETDSEAALRKLQLELSERHLMLADGGVLKLSVTWIEDGAEPPPPYVVKEFSLSGFGAQVYANKMPIPYADLLDVDPEIIDKAVQAALDAAGDADEAEPHDPERAEDLLKKIFGDLYPGCVSLVEYHSHYPLFGFGKSEMVFCQGPTPDEDYFLVDGFSIVRDLKSMGAAIEGWYMNESEEQE
jgi:hypothetical protein